MTTTGTRTIDYSTCAEESAGVLLGRAATSPSLLRLPSPSIARHHPSSSSNVECHHHGINL
eukprot:scaffold7982_cov102-Skeletonema_marinoi.AAC.8